MSVSARRKISERSKKENFSLKLIGSLNVAWTHTRFLPILKRISFFFFPLLFSFSSKGRGLRRRERVVLQNVSEELETANKYSSRHCAASKLRDPAKNDGRGGGFFASSPMCHGHGRTRGRHAAVEKLREGGEGEVEFVSYVSHSVIYIYMCYICT